MDMHWFFWLKWGLMVLIIAFVYCWSKRTKWRLAASLPGPICLPFIGTSYLFVGRDSCTLFNIFVNLHKQYGANVHLWFGSELFLITASADTNEKLLANGNIRNRGHYIEKSIGNELHGGLLVARNEGWSIRRKLASIGFRNEKLSQFVKIYARQSNILVDLLMSNVDGTPVNIERFFFYFSADITIETLFATQINLQHNNYPELVSSLLTGVDISTERSAKFWLMSDWIFKMSSLYPKYIKTKETVNACVRNIIQERRQLLQSKGVLNAEDEDETLKHDLAYIDRLILEKRLTEDELAGEITSMMVAGFDSISWTCSFTMAYLAEYPEIQEKVLEEQKRIFNERDYLRPVSVEDLPLMVYLERVIRESMRLFPAVLFNTRHTEEQTRIGDIEVPANTHILVNHFVMHRDPKYFPNPLQFDPDRFAPENVKNMHPYAYTPFGGGRRTCVGYKAAIMEMKTVFSTILRRIKVVELVGGMSEMEENLEFGIILKPKNGIKLRLLPRIPQLSEKDLDHGF